MASVDGAPLVTPKILTLRSDTKMRTSIWLEREREREILGCSGL